MGCAPLSSKPYVQPRGSRQVRSSTNSGHHGLPERSIKAVEESAHPGGYDVQENFKGPKLEESLGKWSLYGREVGEVVKIAGYGNCRSSSGV
jgi:hypothetical protein